MGYTLAEKLLASHTNDGKATAGDIIEASIDLLMVHEVLGSRILDILAEMDFKKVWDPESTDTRISAGEKSEWRPLDLS